MPRERSSRAIDSSNWRQVRPEQADLASCRFEDVCGPHSLTGLYRFQASYPYCRANALAIPGGNGMLRRAIVVFAFLLSLLPTTLMLPQGAEATGGKFRISYNGGRLTVVGTKGADRIVVVRRKSTVVLKVNGRRVDVGKPITPKGLKRIKLRGLAGNDVLILKEKRGALPTTRLQGGGGDDRLRGGSGPTGMFGRAGDDILNGGAGITAMDGGLGADVLVGGAGITTMTGGAGDDTLTAGPGVTVMDGGKDNDRMTGGAGETTMDGGEGIDQMTGGGGKTVMRGGSGSDVMSGGSGITTMVGGGGDDVMRGGSGPASMAGGSGADQLTGGGGLNEMKGEEGHDVMTGGSGPSTMSGGPNNDTLIGGPNVNTLIGDDGADQLIGGPLADKLSGAAGPDLLIQSPGGDQLAGGDGDDTYQLNADAPGGVINLIESASAGIDTVDLTKTAANDLNLDLSSGAVQPLSSTLSVKLSSGDVFDSAMTGPTQDSIRGNRLDNTLTGGAQDDLIEGRGGNDTITGGAGPDRFVYKQAGAGELLGADVIQDFGNGPDKVALTGLVVTSGLGTVTVTISNGTIDYGTISAGNGHLWAVGDFT